MPTIQDMIDYIVGTIPNAPFDETVDVIKTGNPEKPITGLVTTFLVTVDVIEKTIAQGANFIITHEPTFYNHVDETDWLKDDPVYLYKRKLLDDNGIVVWRFHDYWHSHQPDGIYVGMLKALGWSDYANPEQLAAITLPEKQPLSAVRAHLKTTLKAGPIKTVGPDNMPVQNIALMVGSPGGRWQISVLSENQGLDLLICGEINEWETSEYVRDARSMGREVALLVIGHAASEEAGMAYVVDWLQPAFPGVPMTHIPSGDPFVTA